MWLRNKDTGEKLGAGNIYGFIDKEIEGKFELEIQQIKKSEHIKGMDQN